MKITTSLMTLALLFVTQQGFAAPAKCFGFKGGTQEVIVGWFKRKTFSAQQICIEGAYAKMGYNPIKLSIIEAGFSKGRSGAEISYKASLERFSATGARFTLSDGEPEPTQWEATFNGNELVSVQFERGQVVELIKVK